MGLRNFQLVLMLGLGALGVYLVAFFVWGWFKVKNAALQKAPETPQLKASPQGLEAETAWLIQTTTGKTARLCEVGPEKGLVDIEILDNGGRVRGIVQCVPLTLAYSFTPGNVQALHQFRRSRGIKSAYLVTPGHFEYAVLLEAKKLKIKLIDGAALHRLRQRVDGKPLNVPTMDLFEDHARWQRPPSATPMSSASVLASRPTRHVLIPRTPPVMVPRESEEQDAVAAYKPSVKPIPSEEKHKPSWPVAVSYKRNLPTVIIKPIPTETVVLEGNEASADMTLEDAERMLQARKSRPNRVTRPNR
jgi:hypothetical protein